MFFRGSCLAQKGPKPSRNPSPDPGVPTWVLGLKIPNLHIEKPCRIHYSVFQTEPCVVSYGQKTFRAGWGQMPQTHWRRCAKASGIFFVRKKDIPLGGFLPMTRDHGHQQVPGKVEMDPTSLPEFPEPSRTPVKTKKTCILEPQCLQKK